MFLMISATPVVILIAVALHLAIKNDVLRWGIIVGLTIALGATGYMHLVIIAIMLVCIEVIIHKIKNHKWS